MQMLQFGSNGPEIGGLGGFRFEGPKIVGYKVRESGEQPRRVIKVLQVAV
jgi:hypothetical protein